MTSTSTHLALCGGEQVGSGSSGGAALPLGILELRKH
jgi:hypothetical protein